MFGYIATHSGYDQSIILGHMVSWAFAHSDGHLLNSCKMCNSCSAGITFTVLVSDRRYGWCGKRDTV